MIYKVKAKATFCFGVKEKFEMMDVHCLESSTFCQDNLLGINVLDSLSFPWIMLPLPFNLAEHWVYIYVSLLCSFFVFLFTATRTQTCS